MAYVGVRLRSTHPRDGNNWAPSHESTIPIVLDAISLRVSCRYTSFISPDAQASRLENACGVKTLHPNRICGIVAAGDKREGVSADLAQGAERLVLNKRNLAPEPVRSLHFRDMTNGIEIVFNTRLL